MRDFKYYPEDFGELPVSVLHMNLVFDVYDDHTTVISDMRVKTKQQINELSLNAKDLEIHKVTSSHGVCTYRYEKDFLRILFETPVPKDVEIIIHTETTCRPTKNILEGLYYDETPKGCPCQMITQCQQWGFQRIVPCFDDMTAKCTYTTKIIADVRYTHLLSNGDVVEPRKNAERATIVYDNATTPMAPYLFFLGIGTYDGFTKEVEYANGKKFTIELLALQGADPVAAHRALDILHDGIQWVHIFTGPNMYDDLETRKEIWQLIKIRNTLPEGIKKNSIRKKLQKMSSLLTGYEYTGNIYREIAMQNSNFGGMENVGNTTITANRIMPYADTTDGSFEYMMRVKTHEYYHNLNGSEVTGRSPFEIWLNEAVTVHMERAFHCFMMGNAYGRLSEVLHLIAPGATLDQDAAAGSMPIEPDGFNNPDELITSITYQKAPEFVRMIEVLLGKKQFAQALDLYHKRFAHSNASRADWISAMEEVSGLQLAAMAESWLKQTGYPEVFITTSFEKDIFKLHLTQKGFSKTPWAFPFSVALCDRAGNTIAESITFVESEDAEIVFENVPVPAFISVNREHTMYGKVRYAASSDELYLQARNDSDSINRYLAFYHIADAEKMNLLRGGSLSDSFIALYDEYLSDTKLVSSVGGLFLVITESVENEKYRYKYQDLYAAKKKIRRTIAEKHAELLKKLYIQPEPKKDSYLEQQVASIKYRQIKNLCLGLLAELDTPEIHTIIRTQYESSRAITDRLVALRLYVDSSASDREQLLEDFEKTTDGNLVRYESLLSIIGGSDASDAISRIRATMASKKFRIEQANDHRALFGAFAHNKKISLLTDDGRALLQEILLRLAPVNEYTTTAFLKLFGVIDKLDAEHHIPLVHILLDVLQNIDKDALPSVYNTTRRLLKGAPIAWAAYVQKFPEARYE